MKTKYCKHDMNMSKKWDHCMMCRMEKKYKCHCKADNKKAGKNIYSCFKCEPYKRPKQTLAVIEQRRKRYIAKVTAHLDTPAIRREALKEFNRVNKI